MQEPHAAGSYAYLPANRKRQGGGLGCWLTALVSLAVAGGLIGMAFFLPPFSLLDRVLGPAYTPLRNMNTVSTAGLSVTIPDSAYTGDFGVAVGHTPLDAALAGAGQTGSALAAQPPGTALQSGVYTLRTQGTSPARIALALDIPPAAGSVDLLDLYGYDAETSAWSFIPARPDRARRMIADLPARELPDQVALFQSAPSQPRIIASYEVHQRFEATVGTVASIVAPAGMQPLLDGRLTGNLAPGFDPEAAYRVLPALRNFADPRATDPGTVSAIINNAGVRSQHAAHIAAFAGAGYDGVIVDYRDLDPADRDDFTALVRDIALNLRGTGLAFGVVLPAPVNDTGTWETGAYDWRMIGRYADLVIMRLPLDPAAYAPGADRPVEAMLRWVVGEVPRQRLIADVSALSVRQIGTDFTTLGYGEALSALGNVRLDADRTPAGTVFPGAQIAASLDGYRAQPGADAATGLPYLDYVDAAGVQAARMWLTTPDALRYRLDRLIPFALGGIAFDDLLAEGVASGTLRALDAYRQSLPAQPRPLELALRWTIAGADTVLGEVTTGLNDPLIATLAAPDGNYAVNVEVVDQAGMAQTMRGGVAIALFAPTATPTPLPTATPTPTPAPTSTPARIAAAPGSNAAPSAPSGSGFSAAAPVAGSIVVGNFEYGGHVTSTNTGAAGAMRSAGMNWMKVQVRYSRGNGPGIAADAIAGARGQGFRVLLGVVGYPAELAEGGGAYVSEFASFLGGVAGLGPDAIEVWNEPNIDREWPRDQISGVAYAEMLRQAYQAIKGANSAVMVISGAPAPTGAEAAYPGQVVNDDNWIRQMLSAGAINYMDCLGAHYNEGIVPPSARGGDPRDNYYTRYFWGMLDTYWNLIGGAKPICITELGFLTPEGFPPLPSYFAWAQNVTLAQHAAWLAEAAALSSQSGRVRLMIVWNVDFTNYGADPMAGFAMIRPDGSCPACGAMAGAR